MTSRTFEPEAGAGDPWPAPMMDVAVAGLVFALPFFFFLFYLLTSLLAPPNSPSAFLRTVLAVFLFATAALLPISSVGLFFRKRWAVRVARTCWYAFLAILFLNLADSSILGERMLMHHGFFGSLLDLVCLFAAVWCASQLGTGPRARYGRAA